MNKPHIYKITNDINGKFYYGVHKGSNTEKYMGSGVALKKAQKKYGLNNFSKQILMWFDTIEEAYEYEAVIVNEKTVNNPQCYNIGLGGKGGRCSEEGRKRLSALNKGKKYSIELKKKLSLAAYKKYKDNPELKKTLSLNTKIQHQKMLAEGKSITDRFNNGVKYKCSHCGKETSKGNWKRWHQDNCKHKQKEDK